MATHEDWRQRALCAGHPHREWWFSDLHEDTLRAIAICHVCPVSSQCLSHALGIGEKFGIWGGHTYAQRRRLSRMLRRSAS
jgi:WhiB family redox-sensing transcriptional regulator